MNNKIKELIIKGKVKKFINTTASSYHNYLIVNFLSLFQPFRFFRYFITVNFNSSHWSNINKRCNHNLHQMFVNGHCKSQCFCHKLNNMFNAIIMSITSTKIWWNDHLYNLIHQSLLIFKTIPNLIISLKIKNSKTFNFLITHKLPQISSTIMVRY